MHRSAKRPIILMELLIALALIGTILSILLKFFSSTLVLDRKIDLLRKETIAREHLQIRLLHLFTSIIPRSTLPDASGSSLYSLEEEHLGLAAVFDNGIDPDPLYSGTVRGELSLDQTNTLFISIFPLSESAKKGCRKEFLLQNVEKLEFQFLSKRSDSGSFEWIKTWPKNRWDTPSMVRVILKKGKEELAFAFSLPFADPITYEREQA